MFGMSQNTLRAIYDHKNDSEAFWEKINFLNFFDFFLSENGHFYTVFDKKLIMWGAKIFFSKNQSVISKIGLLEAFSICFGITHVKGEVLSPRFEKQVHFWNLGIFEHFSLILADFLLYFSSISEKGVKN